MSREIEKLVKDVIESANREGMYPGYWLKELEADKAALIAHVDQLERVNAELRQLIRKYLDHTDEGPGDEGWKSNQLQADIAAGEAALEKGEASTSDAP